jgi:hypothetical protein
MKKCKRVVRWHGKFKTIEVDRHSYGWSGVIACTGVFRCVFCGQLEDENSPNGKAVTK